jgi:hypothetical protein
MSCDRCYHDPMKTPELQQFIEDIMEIRPAMAGLGTASSAIIGTTGTEGAAGERLRSDALAFAVEYSQPQPDRDKLLRLAQALEGSLLTVKMVSGLSDAKLDRLVATLHRLLQKI